MGAFDDVKLAWRGKDYLLPADRVFDVACRIEEIITIPALCKSLADNNPSFTKVAMAYGIALRAAGAKVSDEQIYAGMFGSDEQRNEVSAAAQALLAVLMPKDAIDKVTRDGAGATAPANPQ